MDIFSQTQKELHSYFHDKIHIAGTVNDDSNRFLGGTKNRGYEFSQWQMINLIDLYWNSKFETGHIDSEGQRKISLNICRFRSDVAAKQIDLDTKNFTFIPDSHDKVWLTYIFQKDFHQWAKETYLGELINKCVEAFPRYGWVVLRKVKNELEFVPLQTIRNQQDACSLNDAAFVILEHPNMTRKEIQEMKRWDGEGVEYDKDGRVTIYERYGHITVGEYKKHKGEEKQDGDDEKYIDTYAILTCEKDKNKKDADGHVLFIEEITERPFVEARWAEQHGRLMGVGEIENTLENQIGINMAINLHRKQLLWSSKKIFQSTSEGLARNLVRDVKDGDVLTIAPNGNVMPVDMSNRALGDFNAFTDALSRNADQKTFTYEVATGESLPSGTPFRLGVVMSNAVNSHFDMKREKLGFIFKKAIMELMLPQFKKELRNEHMVAILANEEGFTALRELLFTKMVNDAIKKSVFEKGKLPESLDDIKATIRQNLNDVRHMFVKVLEAEYDTLKTSMTLTITGEEIDIPKKIETLTNLYTALIQKGDPRADRVLSRILALTGENYDILAGAENQQQPMQPQGQPGQPLQFSQMNQPSTAAQTL